MACNFKLLGYHLIIFWLIILESKLFAADQNKHSPQIALVQGRIHSTQRDWYSARQTGKQVELLATVQTKTLANRQTCSIQGIGLIAEGSFSDLAVSSGKYTDCLEN